MLMAMQETGQTSDRTMIVIRTEWTTEFTRKEILAKKKRKR